MNGGSPNRSLVWAGTALTGSEGSRVGAVEKDLRVARNYRTVPVHTQRSRRQVVSGVSPDPEEMPARALKITSLQLISTLIERFLSRGS